ncbi:MAG: ATP-binding cassette domain-containing protein, partial [Gammaproteobacteria bacterium]
MNESVHAPGSTPVLSCHDLGKSFREGGQLLSVLSGVDLEIMPADLVAIVGASGSGKTTLLQLLGGLDQPSSGSVSVLGQNLADIDASARGLLRNRHMGFVYQFHHLLPEFSALENVAMPLLVRRTAPREAAEQAAALLQRVG